jgi:hypothetical protein
MILVIIKRIIATNYCQDKYINKLETYEKVRKQGIYGVVT